MKVLQVVGPSSGGIRRHVATLVEGLRVRDFEVSVAAPKGVFDDLLSGVNPVPVSLGSQMLRARRDLIPLVKEAEVVHAHGLTAGWLCAMAGAGDRLVVTVHNLVLDEAAGASAPVLRFLEGRLPARAKETIVISEEMRQRFSSPKGATNHMHLIAPVGPVPEPSRSKADVRQELAVPEGVPLVVLVGRLHQQKAIDVLIEAARHIESPVWIAVIGEGPERENLEGLISRYGLGEVVHLLGRRDDAANYQNAADVVVMCSLWEGFGLVVAEALHLRRPVVATDVGPVSSMIKDGETGRLVPPNDPEALGEAISYLLDHPDLGAEMGERGAKLVAAEFDQDGLIDAVANVYSLAAKDAR